jgi:hypothetical protein
MSVPGDTWRGCTVSQTCTQEPAMGITVPVAHRPYREERLYCSEHGERMAAIGNGTWPVRRLDGGSDA